MFELRSAQLSALTSAVHHQFHHRVLDRLHGERLDEHLTRQEALEHIVAATEAAMAAGFLGAAEVERFVRLAFVRGLGFERLAWAQPIVWDANLNNAERLARLEDAAAGQPGTKD